MTKLGQIETLEHPGSRQITRETADIDGCYHERLMVRLRADGKFLEIWQKGRRRKFAVRYQEIFNYAVMRDIRAAERERKLLRAQKKAERKARSNHP